MNFDMEKSVQYFEKAIAKGYHATTDDWENLANAYVAAGSFTIAIAKIDPAGQKQIYLYTAKASGYYGGVGNIAVGPDGSAYVAGTTASGGLVTTAGSWKQSIGNPQDFHGYLIRLKPDGSAPIFATYIGGDYIDDAYDVAVDSAGNAYVAGDTYSDPRFPGLSGTPLGVSKPIGSGGFIVKMKADGTGPVWSALLPCPRIDAIGFDGAGNVVAAGRADDRVTMAKVSAAGSELLYYSTIPVNTRTSGNSLARGVGLSVDTAGAAYLAGSSTTLQVPELRPIQGVQSNAWFAKVDAAPTRADIALSVQASAATVVPAQPFTVTITVANNGPNDAQDVVVIPAGVSILSCQASHQGMCSTGGVSFPSIPAGQSATIQLEASADNTGVSNGAVIPIQVSSSSLTSDVNRDNNSASTAVTLNYVSISISSNQRCQFQLNGSTQLYGSGFFMNVAPNSSVTIGWPSPQICGFGAASVFQNWSDGSKANPRTFTVSSTLSVSGIFTNVNTPLVSAGGIVNAGSYAGGAVSPGEIVTIYGFNLGGALTTAQVTNGQLATQLGSTRVLFDGVAAPLVYAGSGSVSAIVPYGVAGKSSTSVVVQAGASSSPPVQIPVVDAMPALLTANASGAGQAAALNQDGTLNAPTNPARAGDVIVLYGTGEGLAQPVPPDGAIAGGQPPQPALPITVQIGGVDAQVLYAGGGPGEPAGVIQINARIPAGLASNHHTPVIWSAGTTPSQTGVTIAIQ